MSDEIQKNYTTWQPSSIPATEDYAKWYIELRESLERRVAELENNNSELKNNLSGFKLEYEEIVKDNLRADIKNKKMFWWILLLFPFILLLVLIVVFNLGGNNDKMVNSIRTIIYGLGVAGLVEMLCVGYKNYTMDDRLKSLEEKYSEALKKTK